jgi:hypothetical protein
MLMGKTREEVTVESVTAELATIDADYKAVRKLVLARLAKTHREDRDVQARLLVALIRRRKRRHCSRARGKSMNERECDYRDEPIDAINEEQQEEVRKLVTEAQEAGDLAMEDSPGGVWRQPCLFDGALAYLRAAAKDGQLPFAEVVCRFLVHIGSELKP